MAYCYIVQTTSRKGPPRPRRLLANVVGSLLLASGSLGCSALPTEGRVVVSVTPGKPGAPTETITVSWRDGRGSLRSERRAGSGEVLAAGEANLGEGRLRELWQTVQRRLAPRLGEALPSCRAANGNVQFLELKSVGEGELPFTFRLRSGVPQS